MSTFEPRPDCQACAWALMHGPGPTFDVHVDAERYVTGQASVEQIAKENGVSRQSVHQSIRRHVPDARARRLEHQERVRQARQTARDYERADTVEYKSYSPSFDREAYVTAIREVYEASGLEGPMSHSYYDAHRTPGKHPTSSGGTFRWTWVALCEEAGLPVHSGRPNYSRMADEELVSALATWIVEHRAENGRLAPLHSFYYDAWARKHHTPSRALIVRRVGWSQALDEALDVVYGETRGKMTSDPSVG